ncbi:MAG: glutathione peroxidase [Candidatus Cloacimonetes bacterium HGW-Cloacimonetes-1]|nr:MAG: glutathione peroxidase [Candidatus Cloacimonetes bacterium HGW-Cloacimonetes-1]
MYATKIYDFEMTAIDGKIVKLSDYKGKVVMIVNTASKCGFTKQYKDLQELYSKYEKDGFVILGFPANNFMNQEPGTNDDIQQFCQINFGVSFPMFEKISVKGNDIHPLYQYLTSKTTNPAHGGNISWNFSKFVISRDGVVIDRFSPATNPMSKKVIKSVEKALNQ